MFMVVALAAIGCARSGGNSRADSQEQANRFCVAVLPELEFLRRESFLTENAGRLVELAHAGDLLLIYRDNQTRIAAPSGSTCESMSLDQFGLHHSDQIELRFLAVPTEAVQDAMTAIVSQRGSESQTRQCIVSFHEERFDDLGVLMRFLPFVGLRGVAMHSADGVIFVAADETCETLGEFVRAAVEKVQSRSPGNFRECARMSLRECGYPFELE
ncbi:MAG: hypothetical protein K2P70_12685 [Hyphomonadaceae bacterium]|nr:hypothetical protein [Hyphomonadaceae bacterium]